MNKIKIIIQREYLTRVKKKSFIIMTIIGPILMAALVILPTYIASLEVEKEKIIGVIDESYLAKTSLKNTKKTTFEFINDMSFESAQREFNDLGYDAILYIPESILAIKKVQIVSKNEIGIDLKSNISRALEREIERQKLIAENIDADILHRIKTDIKVRTSIINEQGEAEESFTELSMGLGFIAGFLIYMFIFIYGTQVMRSVIEEKTSRIVEVIISSVKPFQLMMGKIVGVALVGLTQFLLWIVLTSMIVLIAQQFLPKSVFTSQDQQVTEIMNSQNLNSPESIDLESKEVGDIFSSLLKSIDIGKLLISFLFFFLAGYLLYASLFAAVGSAVDNETDTQQFMLPITIPLIFALIMVQAIIRNPEGAISFWLSIIPFTSPIIMMVRIPFGVDIWEIILSIVLLIATFIGTTWIAGKIYKTGILMYGKKVTYKELWKWLKYKN
ncbi:MAG: ABC transporter permease [Bacteroidetes bacterium]|jgi:ABC-2 type transport system permease protein|nr:ABC transporter permease [Bacteroidota bacterium]MBT6688148.1 ABC transporter permease [Bacteroidota bacterium]MBT7141699.1 ABC transporter permease [Bacteroidota bacterium]MBT7490217.1 ABC transporter permease [Bacteroidota bacterium]